MGAGSVVPLIKERIPAPLQSGATFAYQLLTGRRSRFLVARRQARHVRIPRSFNEKIRYKMAHDRRDILTVFADKVAVRGYVRSIVGDSYLSDEYAVSDHASHVPWTSLPREFVCKVSHGCGGNIIVFDEAPSSARLPLETRSVPWTSFRVKPEHAHRDLIAALCKHWQGLDYSWKTGSPIIEWCYQNIRPRILCEEVLRDEYGRLPLNYRFFVFNGRCRAIIIDRTGKHESHNDVLTPMWTRMPVIKERMRWSDTLPERPDNLNEAIEVAEALASPVDFVRVDMYLLRGRIVFGEMTNYPLAGSNHFEPASYDTLWGDWWTLDDYGGNRVGPPWFAGSQRDGTSQRH